MQKSASAYRGIEARLINLERTWKHLYAGRSHLLEAIMAAIKAK